MEFGIVIRRSNNGINKRLAFLALRYKRSGKYTTFIQKLKRDDIGSTKCEFPFKLRVYLLTNNKLRFNVICGTHNHDMYHKLSDLPIACCLMLKEKEIVSDMTLNMVQSKNILTILKRKRKQVYNVRIQRGYN